MQSESPETWVYDLVYKDPETNSDKFWRARVDRRTLFVNFGRVGTRGTTQVTSFTTRLDALTEMHRRGAEKRNKGYASNYPCRVDDYGTLRFKQPLEVKPFYAPTPWYSPPPVLDYKTTLPAYKANQLYQMPEDHFSDLEKRVALEKERRYKEQADARAKKNDYVTAFQNFLLGCAHAMACRAALRWSAGYQPFGTKSTGPGSKATGGKDWTAYDGAQLDYMVRSVIPARPKKPKPGETWYSKQIRTNPLLWTTAGDIKAWLSNTSMPPYARVHGLGGWYY